MDEQRMELTRRITRSMVNCDTDRTNTVPADNTRTRNLWRKALDAITVDEPAGRNLQRGIGQRNAELRVPPSTSDRWKDLMKSGSARATGRLERDT